MKRRDSEVRAESALVPLGGAAANTDLFSKSLRLFLVSCNLHVLLGMLE
jgi:hypothetical protein